MKRNGYFIIKKIVSVLIIVISITTFFGCSKGKSIVLEDDVKKANKSFEGNIKVDEKFIPIAENEGARWFVPSFWQNNKLLGTLSQYKSIKGELAIKEYTDNCFYALDVNKEVLSKTTKKVALPDKYSKKILSMIPEDAEEPCYDFSQQKSEKIFLGKFNCLSNLSVIWPKVVEGNDKFAVIYQYKADKNIESIKLIDLISTKVYKNDNIGDIKIIKVVYIKDLKKFMAIDKKGICYEIKFKESSLKIEKYSEIDTGDLTLQDPYYKSVDLACNDSEVYFINTRATGKNRFIKNRFMKYDFKTKKTDFILNINENDNIRVLKYFPKQNILILYKEDRSKEGVIKEESSEIYLAEIKNEKVNIFYKSKYKNEENKISKGLFEKLGCKNKNKNFYKNCEKYNDGDMWICINEKGNRLAITRDIYIVNKNTEKSIQRQSIDYYDIKRD